MSDIAQVTEVPLWQRIVDFPLVAMVIAVALYVLASALAVFVGRLVSLGAPATTIVHGAITLVFVLAVYKLAIVRLGERPRDDLSAAGSLPELGKGIAAGALLFAAVVGIAALLGIYRIAGAGTASNLLIALVTTAIMPGFMEELLFRGILFRWIEEFAGSWAALAITSPLFGLAHILNPGASWFSSFAIAMEAGLLLGGAYMLTRNLWMPIGLHAAWNFTQGAVFGVPVSWQAADGLVRSTLSGPALLSGGSFGLEASVIALVICTSAGIAFVWLAATHGEVVQPWWNRRRSTC